MKIQIKVKCLTYKGGSGDSKDVIELTDSTFESMVLGSDDIWLVEFFAPWCGKFKLKFCVSIWKVCILMNTGVHLTQYLVEN